MVTLSFRFRLLSWKLEMISTDIRLLLNDTEFWIRIPLEDNVTSKLSDDGDDYYDEEQQTSDVMTVWETAVRPLTDSQRLIFFVITIVVVVFAVIGNILVLYVNFSRFRVSSFLVKMFEHTNVAIAGSNAFSSERV